MSKLLFLLISRSTLPMIYLATFCIQLIIFFSTGTYMIYKLKKSYMYAYRTSKNKVINNLYPQIMMSLSLGVISLVMRVFYMSLIVSSDTAQHRYQSNFKITQISENKCLFNVVDGIFVIMVEFLPMLSFLFSLFLSYKSY